jgi:hypothetical protein
MMLIINSTASSCCLRGPFRLLAGAERPFQRAVEFRRCCFSSSSGGSGAERRDDDDGRLSSSSTPEGAATAIDDDDETVVPGAAALRQQPPRPLFPWRHETHDNLLPRLAAAPSARGDPVFPRPLENLGCCFVLGDSFARSFLGTWRDDLAEGAAWAFARGVAAVVSSAWAVPFKEVAASDDGRIEFDWPPPPPPPDENDGVVEEKEKKDGDSEDKKHDEEDDDDDDARPDVEAMLSQPLRRLYQAAHDSGRDQLLIRLQMEPVDAGLYAFLYIPGLSRVGSERNPDLLQKARLLLASSGAGAAGVPSVQEFVRGVARHLEREFQRHGKFHTTVEVQVLVECREIFQVVDRETGVVLQGSPDGAVRNVVHLVRLEATVEYPHQRNYNWIITDIDDLLDSKPWFLRDL